MSFIKRALVMVSVHSSKTLRQPLTGTIFFLNWGIWNIQNDWFHCDIIIHAYKMYDLQMWKSDICPVEIDIFLKVLIFQIQTDIQSYIILNEWNVLILTKYCQNCFRNIWICVAFLLFVFIINLRSWRDNLVVKTLWYILKSQFM